jgi:hypothetical protein
MTKAKRLEVHSKYNGHCAYCGKIIAIKDMQVDHIKPKRQSGSDESENLNPACRQCNHYKRAGSLAYFRALIITLHNRVRGIYICKVAEDYGIIKIEPWDGKFYFERVSEDEVHN